MVAHDKIEKLQQDLNSISKKIIDWTQSFDGENRFKFKQYGLNARSSYELGRMSEFNEEEINSYIEKIPNGFVSLRNYAEMNSKYLTEFGLTYWDMENNIPEPGSIPDFPIEPENKLMGVKVKGPQYNITYSNLKGGNKILVNFLDRTSMGTLRNTLANFVTLISKEGEGSFEGKDPLEALKGYKLTLDEKISCPKDSPQIYNFFDFEQSYLRLFRSSKGSSE